LADANIFSQTSLLINEIAKVSFLLLGETTVAFLLTLCFFNMMQAFVCGPGVKKYEKLNLNLAATSSQIYIIPNVTNKDG
jgi:hypothetical protein